MKYPRIMIAAPASGSGKTMVTCGLLQALINRNKKVSAFKCGPDYIDPMFHTKVIGVPSRNLDTFFTDHATTRYLFGKNARGFDLSVIEGVMGFYDGAAGITSEASSWDVANATDTPVILVVNAKGMSLSVVAQIKGFLDFCAGDYDSHIRGVILNQASAAVYPDLKRLIESKLPVKVLGYVPRVEDCVIGSRHLGLVTPDEIGDLKGRLNRLAGVMEDTVDIDSIIEMAQTADDIDVAMPVKLQQLFDSWEWCIHRNPSMACCEADNSDSKKLQPRIAAAHDEAFCFYYEDNLALLRELGAELISFSPLHDETLPENIHGLLLGGGYPELYAEKLSQNHSMRRSIRRALQGKLPCVAECGGFMYLHNTMEDMNGQSWPMVGAIDGHVHRTGRLGRFGYVTLTARRVQLYGDVQDVIRGHEFHYFDSSNNGSAFHAEKPYRKTNWECVVADDSMAAGFPHLYYYSNPKFAMRFVERCADRL